MAERRRIIDATVRLAAEPTHDLPRTQYGHFIEHVGRSIKPGIWSPGEQPDMFLGGVRRDLLDATRSLRPAAIRYPGGCFADGYHWRDGIGPRASRPRRRNRMWGKFSRALGPVDDNHFGTDEFLAFCKAVGAQPMLTVNVGSGTPREAADWVEYVNGRTSTPMGALRAANGHPDPYRVRYWFVGNEIFGPHEIGHLSPRRYLEVFLGFAAAMRAADNSIQLIACGAHFALGGKGYTDLNAKREINRIVLEGLGNATDYLSVHQYAPRPGLRSFLRYQILRRHRSAGEDVYYEVIGTYRRMRSFLEGCISDCRTYSPPGKRIPLVFDEWNLWFALFTDLVQANYNLRDGVWTATILNLLHEFAPEIPIANVAQLVNCLGLISSCRRGTFITPSGLVLGLYAQRAGDRYVPATIEAPALEAAGGLPALDASVTSTDERLSIFLVNRHYDSTLNVRIEIGRFDIEPHAVITRMHHDNPAQYNTFDRPDAVRLVTAATSVAISRSDAQSAGFDLALDPHSVMCAELPLRHLRR